MVTVYVVQPIKPPEFRGSCLDTHGNHMFLVKPDTDFTVEESLWKGLVTRNFLLGVRVSLFCFVGWDQVT